MADPIGTVGAVPSQAETDLNLIFKGGDKFLQRMQALANEREAHDAAFDQLHLGMSAQAAFDHAQKLVGDAETARANAAAVEDDANKKAADLLAKANAEATRIKTQATEQATGVRGAADIVKSEADKQALKLRKEAADLANAALKKKAEADNLAIELEAAAHRQEVAHNAALTAAKAAKDDADALSDKLRAKLAKLHTSVKSLADELAG